LDTGLEITIIGKRCLENNKILIIQRKKETVVPAVSDIQNTFLFVTYISSNRKRPFE
jgi:hypothetical protein